MSRRSPARRTTTPWRPRGPGLAVAEQQAGSGGSWLELAVVLEETGRCLLRAPYLSTVVAAAAMTGADDLVTRLADGSARAALALDDDVQLDGGRVTGTL